MVQILVFDWQVLSSEKSQKLLSCDDSCPSLLKLKMVIEWKLNWPKRKIVATDTRSFYENLMIFSWAFEKAFNTPRVVVFIFPGRLCVFLLLCAYVQTCNYLKGVQFFWSFMAIVAWLLWATWTCFYFYYLLRYLCIAL